MAHVSIQDEEYDVIVLGTGLKVRCAVIKLNIVFGALQLFSLRVGMHPVRSLVCQRQEGPAHGPQ